MGMLLACRTSSYIHVSSCRGNPVTTLTVREGHIFVRERVAEKETRDSERRREREREEGVQEDPGKQFDMSIMVVRSDLNILHET